MKPNVLFIVLPYVVHDIDSTRPKIRSYHAFPYGLLSIATYCKDLMDIRIIDCDTDPKYKDTIQQVLENDHIDIVGISMMFDISYIYLEELLSLIKNFDPTILTVLGGAAASYSPEEILKEQDDLDALCYAEGEIPFRRLLESWKQSKGIGFLDNHPSWITRTTFNKKQRPVASFIQNLDDVINIDYSFIDTSRYETREAFSPFSSYDRKHKQFFISTSRGCPFNCTFCSNSKIHGKKMRFAGVDVIINHIRKLVSRYEMDVLTIYDDQLLIDMPRAKELFRRLAEFNLRIECPNGLSVRYIDSEMAKLMKLAGMDTIYLAIESGSEYVLKKLIHKPLELSMVAPAVKALRKYDIFIHAFLVMGMPGEKSEHRKETSRFIKSIGIDWSGFQMAMPFKGSRLYEICIKNGWIDKQSINSIDMRANGIFVKTIINIPGIDKEKVNQEVYEMNLDVNFHNNYRMKIGDYKTAARCFEEVLRRYKEHKWAKHYLEICEQKLLDKLT